MIDSTSLVFRFVLINNANRLQKGKNQDKPSFSSHLLRLENTWFKRRLQIEDLNVVGPEITSWRLFRIFMKELSGPLFSFWWRGRDTHIRRNILPDSPTKETIKWESTKSETAPKPWWSFHWMLRHIGSVERCNTLGHTTVHSTLYSN